MTRPPWWRPFARARWHRLQPAIQRFERRVAQLRVDYPRLYAGRDKG